MATGTIAAYPTLTAKVQWWDDRSVYVLCPWCDEIHHHGFDKVYAQSHLRVSHCFPTRTRRFSLKYEIEFPIGESSTSVGYEIDKENVRFVAGGARLPLDDVANNQADHLRAVFRERVEKKRKFTEAIETELILDDFSERKIVCVTGKMVEGNVAYVRQYLESSSEAHIFLHGVDSWETTHYDAFDDDGEETSGEVNSVETSGKTALHMAACEACPEMVELLLSNGADANATDLDGRTALMEAALWGRLKNIEILLKYGADKSMTCIDDNRLRRAADFARPLKQNAETRRARAGGYGTDEPIYKEDTYARDRDRRVILRLLEGAAGETSPPQLDVFSFQRSLNDYTRLSLTTHYSLHNERKTVARMVRGGGLPEVAAMSGWSHARSGSIHVAGRDWTDKVLHLFELVGFNPARGSYDRGVPGRFNACHAEKQLVAYFIHRHLFLDDELKVPEEPEDEFLISMLTLADLTEREREQRTREQAQRKKEQAYKLKLVELWKASPSISLKGAHIIVSRPVCHDCRRFVERINDALGLNMQLHHRCLDSSCNICPD